ncbi:MAG: signal peptide peptidase SppA [Rickettsiales bacterium]|jgi:protease IV|nr:signal peptide peptidase SppA [Rickettsiales bacterium]
MTPPKLSSYFNAEFLRRKLNLWRIFSLAILLVCISLTYEFDDLKKPRSDYVARIAISGFIGNDQYRLDRLEELSKDKFLKAVIIDIDSPGGTVVGGELLYQSLKRLSNAVPTVAFVGSQATSAAYLAAIGCNYIISPQGSIVGSIGVILQSVDLSGLAKSLGIEPVIVKSTSLKAVPHFAEKLTSQGEASLREVVDDIYKMFKTIVLERRPLKESNIEEVMSGKVFSGNRAYKLGLVDEVGDSLAVKQYLLNNNIGKNIDIKKVSLQENDVPSFLKIFSPMYKVLQNNFNILSLY